MLKIILNRLQPQAEDIIAEEKAGFRAGRSTTEQIFSLRILCVKYLQHQQNIYHVFIDFKKAFGRVWRKALWAALRKCSINTSIIRAIDNLYDNAQSAVLFNGSTGEWFRTTVGVRQGYLLLQTLFNIFLERISVRYGMSTKVVSASEDDLLPKQKDKQWSGIDTIRSHILPSKPKRKITKYINWQQFTKGTRGKPNEQVFPRQVVVQLPKIY